MKKHITAFYLETLLLVAVFVAIILVLTGIFGVARAESSQAEHLTKAVLLAENAAEAVSVSGSLEVVRALLDERGDSEVNGNVLTVYEEDLQADITWEPEGSVVSSSVTVYWNGKAIYTLKTAAHVQEEIL